LKSNFSLDRLATMPPKHVGTAAFRVINALQDLPPEGQIAGAVIAAQLILRKYGVHVGTAHTIANNMIDRAAAATPALQAVMQYIDERV
jgi:hypothetical protein